MLNQSKETRQLLSQIDMINNHISLIQKVHTDAIVSFKLWTTSIFFKKTFLVTDKSILLNPIYEINKLLTRLYVILWSFQTLHMVSNAYDYKEYLSPKRNK